VEPVPCLPERMTGTVPSTRLAHSRKKKEMEKHILSIHRRENVIKKLVRDLRQ
jgi:hypothetical protein